MAGEDQVSVATPHEVESNEDLGHKESSAMMRLYSHPWTQ